MVRMCINQRGANENAYIGSKKIQQHSKVSIIQFFLLPTTIVITGLEWPLFVLHGVASL